MNSRRPAVPITPIDDAGRPNPYPLMRLTARNSAGAVLAQTDVVLPVSGEMDCRACHASGAGAAARPAAGWVNDPIDKRDFRLNILRLHDEKQRGEPRLCRRRSRRAIIRRTASSPPSTGGTPILCASCHASEALGTAGAPGVPPLTRVDALASCQRR